MVAGKVRVTGHEPRPVAGPPETVLSLELTMPSKFGSRVGQHLDLSACMQVVAGAVCGSTIAVAWFWLAQRWLAEAMLPALQRWPIVKALGFKDVWRENPDEILYKEREWYELRGARKKTR